MQYTPHYNLNLPEGTDIVNPLIQDNPNYSAIDTAMYDNKLRVIGNATHVKTGTNHAITLSDSDILAFKFVATGDYATGDTFTVDGVTVTARIADGSSIPSGAFKINSTVLAILDGTLLNLINIQSTPDPDDIILSNGVSVEDSIIRGSYTITSTSGMTWADVFNDVFSNIDTSKISNDSIMFVDDNLFRLSAETSNVFHYTFELVTGSEIYLNTVELKSSSTYVASGIRPGNPSNASISDVTNLSCPVGTVVTLYY